MSRRRWILVPVAALVVAVPAPATAGVGTVARGSAAPVTWGIVPAGPDGPDGRAAFDHAVDPGARIADRVRVINYSQKPIDLALYATDAARGTDGGFDLIAAADEPTGAGAWVTLERRAVTIPARDHVDVGLEIRVPRDATPGDHAGGVVAAMTTRPDNEAGGRVAIERRVGARIYLRVSGNLVPKLTVTDLDASFDALAVGVPGDVRVRYRVHNEGNMRLVGRSVLRVAGPFGLGAKRITGPLPELLPGASAPISAVVPGNVPLGRLGVGVEVRPDTSGTDVVTITSTPGRANTAVWAIPWITLLVLGALAGIGWLRSRRNRARPPGTSGPGGVPEQGPGGPPDGVPDGAGRQGMPVRSR